VLRLHARAQEVGVVALEEIELAPDQVPEALATEDRCPFR
jgi:hypothetical protein